jgi:uncharacterized protein YgiM (DUF1202 family)
MNKNCWLLIGLMVATSAVAQGNTNTPAPVIPAPTGLTVASVVPAPPAAGATNAPVKKKKAAVKHKKAVVAEAPKKAALTEPTVTLVPGPAEVAADNVNVRGQAGLKGEFITHLDKGDAVVVLSQINLDKHQVDEPAQWAKIAFPTNAHVWVNSTFIDATNKTVLPKKLNLRAGPGENYSVLGVVERGTPLNTLTVRGAWTQIEPPASAYAFIAAMYLKQEASGSLAANPPASTETQPAPAPVPVPVPEAQPVPPPSATPVPEAQAIVTEPTNPPVVPAPVPVPAVPVVAAAPTNTPALTETNPVAALNADTNAAAVDETNLPPRIVTHEGVVRHVVSIIEPTEYEIYDPKTDFNVDYLYTTTTNLDFSLYKGLRIVVTGEEKLSQRWHHTPVLTVTRIQVVK